MPFDLEAEIARRLNVSRDAVAPVLDAVIERIRKQVSHFGYARLAGLGTFRGQNGRLSFEPEAALSDQVNVRFAGLEEITVEAPPLSDKEDHAGLEVPFEDTDRVHTAPDAADIQDSSTEADAGIDFDTEEEGERADEAISEEEGEPVEVDEEHEEEDVEPVEVDEEHEEEDAEYGEAPGEDYERSESGSGLGTEIDEEDEHPETAYDVEDAELEGWLDEEEEPEAWLGQSDEEHPLGPESEHPFEEADYSVLDERQEAASKRSVSGDADAELDAGDAESAGDLQDDDSADEDVAADAESGLKGDLEDGFRYGAPAAWEADLADDDGDYPAGKGYVTADEDDFPADDDDFLADEDDHLADEDLPADSEDYPPDEDDYFEGEESYLNDELVEDEERTPSVEWNVPDAPAGSATYEGDAEYGDEAEDEDAGIYAASGAAASGQQREIEEETSVEGDDAQAHAVGGGAAQHERLRQPSERRHAAARAAGGGAAGGNRSAIWIGVGVLVLVAAAAVAYFSMTPSSSVSPGGPPVTEERDAPAPADTSAAASADASTADESAADTAVAATPPTPAVQEDPDPLRSPEGIDLSTGGYTLIVYSETSESGASNVMDQFRENGFRTSVLEDQEGATTRYRVGVGQFATLDEAVEARDRLAGDELPDDAWVRRIQ